MDVSTKQELRRAVAELLGVPESHVLLAASAVGGTRTFCLVQERDRGHSWYRYACMLVFRRARSWPKGRGGGGGPNLTAKYEHIQSEQF